jgi:hypothetical protein
MNSTIYFDRRYLKFAKKNSWDLANKVLYDLCAKFPHHKNKSEVMAKVMLIGRSYAASIERRKNKRNNYDDFYEDVVAPTLMKSKLDRYLSRLDGEERILESNIEAMLKTHKYLVDLFQSITKLDKRSLASKYLHFHYPNLFYLYDSRAAKSLNKCVGCKTKPSRDFDSTYASFFKKAYELQKYIENKYKQSLSPRELDKILLWIYE